MSLTSVLVANRGEIARRVFRTARSMGLRCVAVYADADAGSPHVTDADEAVRLPDGGYLDADAVVAAALATGADAVHPGYGFLAENAGFAEAVEAAGLVWVGPTADVVRTMGDKLAAKEAAVAAGVPTLPSSDDPTDGEAVGYPLLVKAAAGGGGKGMHLVESAADLDEAVASAQREALGAFGDDRVFLERYVPRSRHLEVQVLGDAHGNLVHLGERECSIQRRHQKVLEESPSPFADEALRSAMCDAALRLADGIGYRSAGTVEFLVDDATGEFFFLEVNTRLQVEHPVTEEVTGIDLVREQLRVAAGEPLGWTQDDLATSGRCSPRWSPTGPRGPRPPAGSPWPSSAATWAASPPTATSSSPHSATRPSSPATPPPTSSSATPRRPPAPATTWPAPPWPPPCGCCAATGRRPECSPTCRRCGATPACPTSAWCWPTATRSTRSATGRSATARSP